MMRGDEMAQETGAASAEDTLAASLRRAMIDSDPRRASPPPAHSGGVGRLAQLARLIEQDETLAAIVRGSQPEQPVELSLSREKLPSSHLAQEGKAFDHHWEGEAGLPLVHPGLCDDDPADEPQPPPEYGEYDVPDYSNGLPDQRRGLKVFAALIGLALASSASALAYWELSEGHGRGHEVSVKAPSRSPDKTAPLPREHRRSDERPRDQSDERSVNATGRTMTGAEEAGAEEPAEAKPPMPPVQPPTSIAFGSVPTKIAELTPEPTPPGNPAGTAQNQPPDVKKPVRRRTAPRGPEPSGAHGVRYVVQLSSERNEAAAHARARAMQIKYQGAFAGRKPFIRRADVADRGVYYRVQMGPFAIGEANQICRNLKKSGADCVVQRNEGHAPKLKDDP